MIHQSLKLTKNKTMTGHKFSRTGKILVRTLVLTVVLKITLQVAVYHKAGLIKGKKKRGKKVTAVHSKFLSF